MRRSSHGVRVLIASLTALVAVAPMRSTAVAQGTAPAAARPTAQATAPSTRPATTATLPSFRSSRALRAYLLSLREPPRPYVAWDPARPAPWCAPGTPVDAARSTRRWPWSRAQVAPVRISGTVRDSLGHGIAGAQVWLACDGVGAVSDSTGRFEVELKSVTRERDVSVLVRAIGYRRSLDTMRVRPGRHVSRDVRLIRDVMHLEQVVVTGASTAAAASSLYGGGLEGKVAGAGIESITNTQHAGVDEGGIVKLHGDHLVVLRRGRLFTVRVGDDALRPVAMVDAYPPDPKQRGGWYDELVVSGDRAVVIGYSYARAATEVNLFRLDAAGGIRYEASYHLRSDDYYSSRNYASRVVDGTLLLYTPLHVRDTGDPLEQLPALRRWNVAGDTGRYERIVPPSHVHQVRGALSRGDDIAFHAVTRCDLATEPLRCTSRVIIGPPSEVYYVSPRAVYLWTSAMSWRGKAEGPSLVMRLPLDGGAPSAVQATGSPIDQFSFLEEQDGTLQVLVDADGRGDWMWSSEKRARQLALARIPASAFGDGQRTLPRGAMRVLPNAGAGLLHNRFVGHHLLYGGGHGWSRVDLEKGARLVVVDLRGGVPAEFRFKHGVDRIEPMGNDAVVVGTDGKDLQLVGVRLGATVQLAQRMTVADAAEAETRSHGFFYRPTDARTGMIGLPIAGATRRGWEQLRKGAASVLFVRNDGEAFADAGALDATESTKRDDGCVASCADWYGNARPIFLRGRVYALMGYELVEGRVEEGAVREVRRVEFWPRMMRTSAR